MIRGLKPRFIIFLVLIVTMGIGLSFYWQLSIQYNHLMEMSKEKLEDFADLTELSIKDAMKEGRSEAVQKILETLGTLPEMDKVRIFSPDGIILASSRPEERGKRIDPHHTETLQNEHFSTIFALKSPDRSIFYVIKAIKNEPACFHCHGRDPSKIIGLLDVEIKVGKLYKRMYKARESMAISALVTLVAMIISIYFLLSRLINRPIDSLARTMRRAEKGDLTARVELVDTLEFEDLGKNFNTMISRLEKSQEDLKRAHEEKMERVERLASLGELAASIAHEIKNPIAGIGGAIQILMKDFQEDDERREIFTEVLTQIDRIDRDVKGLLNYARTDSPEFAEHDISKILKQVLFLVQDLATKQNVDIEIVDDGKVPSIWVDEKQMQQVFVNLGLNAVQAMSEGGALTITVKLANTSGGKGFLEVQVKDTGGGIPQDKMSKIFTPFYTTRHTGTGLGLSISKEIISQHGGKIEVSSESGKGTCFTVFLPLAKKSAPETKSDTEIG